MGYELNFKLELTGLYYLDGLLCTINIEEFCDDQGDPESATISITKLQDTNQGLVAKEVLKYDNSCKELCVALHKSLKEFPYKTQK